MLPVLGISPRLMRFQIPFPEIGLEGLVLRRSGRIPRQRNCRVWLLNRISVLRPEAIPVRPLLPIAVRVQAALRRHIGEQKIRWHRRDSRMFMVVSHTRSLRNISVTPRPRLLISVSIRRILLHRGKTSSHFSLRSLSIKCNTRQYHLIWRSLTWDNLTWHSLT